MWSALQPEESEEVVLDGEDVDLVEAGFRRVASQHVRVHDGAGLPGMLGVAPDGQAVQHARGVEEPFDGSAGAVNSSRTRSSTMMTGAPPSPVNRRAARSASTGWGRSCSIRRREPRRTNRSGPGRRRPVGERGLVEGTLHVPDLVVRVGSAPAGAKRGFPPKAARGRRLPRIR